MNYLMKIVPGSGSWFKRDVAVITSQSSFKMNLKSFAHCIKTDENPLEMLGKIDKKYIHYIYTISRQEDKSILIHLSNTFEGFLVGNKYYELIFNPNSMKILDSSYGLATTYRLRHDSFDVDCQATPTISFSFGMGGHCDLFEEVPFSLDSSLYKLHHNKKEEHKNIVFEAYKKIRTEEIQNQLAQLKEELENMDKQEVKYSGKVILNKQSKEEI